MDIDILTNSERFREWYNSVGSRQGLSILLDHFHRSSSPEYREILWKAVLELVLQENDLPTWRDELLKALSNELPQIRSQALSALTDTATHLSNDLAVSHAVAQSLYDDSEHVRAKAIYASSNFATRQLLSEIMDSLLDPESYRSASDDPDRRYVWHSLFALDQVVDRLALNAQERDMSSARIDQVLSKLLEKPDRSKLDIWKVGDSLGEHVKGSQALGTLQKMFKNPDAVVRDSSVHGLGHIDGDHALRLIRAALSDADSEVREEARRALAEAGYN